MSDLGPDPLLAGLADDEEHAFAAVYDRYAGRLYRAALASLGRREDAEDAVQEVFAALVRSRRQLSEIRDLAAYLFVSLRHTAARIAQRRAQQPVASQTAADQAASDDPPSGSPYDDRLLRALEALPPRQREVVSLKIDGELTFDQIARVLGVSQNTAASRYRYALQKLRDLLQLSRVNR